MRARNLLLSAILVFSATTASAVPANVKKVKAESIDEHAKELAKFTFDSVRERVFGSNLKEMLIDYAQRFKWTEKQDVVIEHFPSKLSVMPDYFGLVDIQKAIEILNMPLLEYTEAQIKQIKGHLAAILKLGGKIAYTTSGGMTCEEWWPSVLIIDPFKKVITEFVTIHIDC